MRFKSVLGAFLFILLAGFLALVVFVQTKSFGRLVTKVVTDISERKLQTKVKIKSISISVFPPGLELNRVRVKKKISDVEKISVELGKVGFYIGLIEIEEKNLTFGEIKISDSIIDYRFPKTDEELKEIDQKVLDKVFRIPDELPVRIDTLIVENSHIYANHDLVDIRRLKLFKKDDAFVTRFHLSNIKPNPESDFVLDEIWGDGEISRKDIEIYRIRAQHDVQNLLLKGSIKDFYKLKGSTAKLIGEAQFHLESLGSSIPVPEMIDLRKGEAKISYTADYKAGDLSATADLYLDQFRSNLFFADELKALAKFEKNKLSVTKFGFKYKDQKVNLTEPVVLFQLQDKSFLTHPVHASVENLKLSNAIRILGPGLNPLKGELNGAIIFEYKKGDLYFKPQDGFTINNLGLVVGEKSDPFKILMIKKARLQKSEFAVVKNEFRMSAIAELPKSKLQIDGFINSKNLSFVANNSTVDLEDFGNISNLDIKGAGNLDINVSGLIDKTVITLKGKTRGFEILGYRLDETEKDIQIDLENSDVIIRKMESRYGRTNLTGTGTVNYKDLDIALGVTSTDANAADLTDILHPIFKDIDFLPKDLDYKAKIDVDIFGKTRLDDLKLRAKVNFADLKAYGEVVPNGSFTISMLNRVLSFKDFEAEKGKGIINGDLAVGLKDKTLKMNYSWDNLELSSLHISKILGLNLNSTLSGSISGGGPMDNYVLKLDTTAFNTRTTNYTFQDSQVAMEIRPQRISGKASVFGKTIDSVFNVSLKKGLASSCSVKIQTSDIKPILVAVLGQHLESEPIIGRINYEGSTVFGNGFTNLDLTGNLKEFVFHHPDFNVEYFSTKPQFVVRDSKIQSWNLNIREPDLYVSTKGEGIFGKQVSLVQEVHLNSKLLEIFLAPVLSSEGFLRNIVRIDGRGTEFDVSVTSKAERLNLNLERVPIPINGLTYDIEYADKRLVIQDLATEMEGGSAKVKGDIFFDNEQPDVNLKYILQNAEIPILGKSSANISGEGILLGNNFPYTLGGEIVINRAQIVNELNEFSNKSAGFSQVRFLPKNQDSSVSRMLALNLTLKAENPVRITNSLMDVALKGEVRLFGNPTMPRGEGRLFAPLGSSRIFFKNSEYVIQSADINFNPKKDISNPDFDVQAVTVISTYKVYPKAYGDLERFSFDLTSDPVLPRNSILSLIAFGYTQDIQNTLQAKDQQSLTQVGVGSFVFDRFKISDILNKQFGLQINLGTVIEQSGTDSLLNSKAAGNDSSQTGAFGRTRSATRIELRKRLDEATTLSVSSTMGGSIGQRQSMNLNYGVSRNIQLEGVYELRTNEEGQADINYNSIGADIKFRRTFK